MLNLATELVRMAALSTTYLDGASRREVIRFIRSRWNFDGGVQGRDQQSDLYYTVFAAVCLRALKAPLPYLRFWNYVRSFGEGETLDSMDTFHLIRLRSAFPMKNSTRKRLMKTVAAIEPASAYDLFFKVVTTDCLGGEAVFGPPLRINPNEPTTNIAATVAINRAKNLAAEKALMARYCETGGFCISDEINVPDLLSTATALFSLHIMGSNMEPVREATLQFVESLWRDSGGFAGHSMDGFEDVEYTYYALLSIGCLIG